jgi:hypothetical protein
MRTLHTPRRLLHALGIALTLCVALVLLEYFMHTRLQSTYISSNEFHRASFYLLVGKRERGTMVIVPGKGFHSAKPGQTHAEVIGSLRARYPNEFDERKVTWVLQDEEGAFFYHPLK